jgi:murein DD-endopeptidase MepM/ murein hydrolase activator NlpD
VRGAPLVFLLLLSSTLGAAEPLRVTQAARSIQPGELVVLTIMPVPESTREVHVVAFGRTIPAFKAGEIEWHALVAIDLDTPPGVYPVSIETRPGSGAQMLSELRVKPRHFPTRTLQVDEAFVTVPPALEARTAREAADLQRLWTASSPQRLWSGPFVRPVPGRATSIFGTRSIYNGKPRSPHSGADFLSPAGTDIGAPNAGRIVLARELYFSGNTVVIDHGLGLFSLLAHLSEIDVHEGDTVATGEVVGRVGATGRVTGPHLHWAVRASGARVDPLSLLALLGRDAK